MKLLIVGTVRNLASRIENEINTLLRKLSSNFDIDFFIIESDSNDSSITKLQKLQDDLKEFKFQTAGKLQSELPDRIERLRYCRNLYVNYIRDNYSEKSWDFTLVVDFDGMNHQLDAKGLLSCIQDEREWDGCFPVQARGYYDLLALRHRFWMPGNCFEEIEWWKTVLVNETERFRYFGRLRRYLAIDEIKREKFYSKMLQLKSLSDWIQVDSAFGGAALYKTAVFMKHDYSRIENSDHRCEHVDFNLKLKNDNAKLFINPKFINSNWNSYNLNRIFLVRLYRSRNLSVRRILLKTRRQN